MAGNEDTPIVNFNAIVGAIQTVDTDVKTVDTDVKAIGTAVTNLATAVSLLRWGFAIEPDWYGGVTNNPGAAATLATRTVAGGKTGHVFGVIISTAFADTFQLLDNAGLMADFVVGANGQAYLISPKQLGDAVATHVITIKTTAGGVGNVLAKFLESET